MKIQTAMAKVVIFGRDFLHLCCWSDHASLRKRKGADMEGTKPPRRQRKVSRFCWSLDYILSIFKQPSKTSSSKKMFSRQNGKTLFAPSSHLCTRHTIAAQVSGWPMKQHKSVPTMSILPKSRNNHSKVRYNI